MHARGPPGQHPLDEQRLRGEIRDPVALVEDHQVRHVALHHLQQQRCLERLVGRAPEAGHEPVRQVVDEADRVRDDHPRA
jgi:hypothetical protein